MVVLRVEGEGGRKILEGFRGRVKEKLVMCGFLEGGKENLISQVSLRVTDKYCRLLGLSLKY